MSTLSLLACEKEIKLNYHRQLIMQVTLNVDRLNALDYYGIKQVS